MRFFAAAKTSNELFKIFKTNMENYNFLTCDTHAHFGSILFIAINSMGESVNIYNVITQGYNFMILAKSVKK